MIKKIDKKDFEKFVFLIFRQELLKGQNAFLPSP